MGNHWKINDLPEESSTLNIREAHERPEAMEEASVMMVGLNPERIIQGLIQLQYQKTGLCTQQINKSTNQHKETQQINESTDQHKETQQINESTNQPERNFRPVGDYSMPNVSEKVVRIILGYTDYIKRTVWSED